MIFTLVEHWDKICTCMDAPVLWNDQFIIDTIGEENLDIQRTEYKDMIENDLRCSVCNLSWLLISTEKIPLPPSDDTYYVE